MTGIVKLYDSLVSDYDRAQTELNEVDRNLRKLAGSREAGADSRGRASLLVDRNNRKRRISDVSSSRRNG